MTIEDFVTHEINEYQTDNVREIIDYHDISIEYNDQLNKACDSSIFLFHQTAYITIKSDLNPLYENFLLAHELGHYLAFIAGNVDKSSSFAAVYNSEKSKFTGVRKAYATQNASEYFAESVQNYVENPAALKAQRPQTYEAVKNALAKVTDAQVNKIINVYKVIWK